MQFVYMICDFILIYGIFLFKNKVDDIAEKALSRNLLEMTQEK